MERKGFIPVMLTPFNEDGSVDYNGLTALTEFYLEAGAVGLFANCLSSEMFELTEAERIQITKHVVEVAGKGVPVVSTGTFEGTVESQAGFIQKLYDTGIEAAILITGMIAAEGEPDTVFDERVFRLMDLTPHIPLGFYECPVPYKRLLKAEQLGRFAATGRIIYHKDTSLSMDSVRAKLAAVQEPRFGLYDAYMVHAIESLKAGAAGLSCIQGNFFPELIVWLCNNYNKEDLQPELEKVQQFLTDNMEVMHDVYPAVAKYFLQKRGLSISTFTRRRTAGLDTAVKSRIDDLFLNYSALQKLIA